MRRVRLRPLGQTEPDAFGPPPSVVVRYWWVWTGLGVLIGFGAGWYSRTFTRGA